MFVKLKGQIKIFTVKKIHFRNVFYNSYNIAMLLPKLQNWYDHYNQRELLHEHVLTSKVQAESEREYDIYTLPATVL